MVLRPSTEAPGTTWSRRPEPVGRPSNRVVLRHATASAGAQRPGIHEQAPRVIRQTAEVLFAVGDLETYKRFVENRTIDPRRSRVGRQPKLVTEWTIDELQAWLDAN